jgi:hypothetical protein
LDFSYGLERTILRMSSSTTSCSMSPHVATWEILGDVGRYREM